MSDVVLSSAGVRVDRFERLTLRRSMEELAHHLSGTVRAPLVRGASVTLEVDGGREFTGYVQRVEESWTATSHSLSFAAPSKAGDLVRASSSGAVRKWKNATLMQIAKDLISPFKINVTSDLELSEPFSTFSVEEGERVFTTLERAASYRQVMMLSDGDGNIAFIRASKERTRTTLQVGDRRVVSVRRSQDDGERFSVYAVKAQTKGTDTWNGDAAARGFATSTDPGVDRYLPLVVLPQTNGFKYDLQARADHERNVRAGRSDRLIYTVRGWRDDHGAIWRPNTLVHIRDERISADLDLLIVTATLHLTPTERYAELELCPPQAFDVVAKPKKRSKRKVEYGF